MFDDKMYLFMDTGNPVVFDGILWGILDFGFDNVKSFRSLSQEPFSRVSKNYIDRESVEGTLDMEPEDVLEVYPINHTNGIKSAAVDGSSLVLGTTVNGRVYHYVRNS